MITLFINNPFNGLVISQMLLSIQLPFTIFLQIYLTSSKNVMGRFKNSVTDKYMLFGIGIIVVVLNVILFFSML